MTELAIIDGRVVVVEICKSTKAKTIHSESKHKDSGIGLEVESFAVTNLAMLLHTRLPLPMSEERDEHTPKMAAVADKSASNIGVLSSESHVVSAKASSLFGKVAQPLKLHSKLKQDSSENQSQAKLHTESSGQETLEPLALYTKNGDFFVKLSNRGLEYTPVKFILGGKDAVVSAPSSLHASRDDVSDDHYGSIVRSKTSHESLGVPTSPRHSPNSDVNERYFVSDHQVHPNRLAVRRHYTDPPQVLQDSEDFSGGRHVHFTKVHEVASVPSPASLSEVGHDYSYHRGASKIANPSKLHHVSKATVDHKHPDVDIDTIASTASRAVSMYDIHNAYRMSPVTSQLMTPASSTPHFIFDDLRDTHSASNVPHTKHDLNTSNSSDGIEMCLLERNECLRVAQEEIGDTRFDATDTELLANISDHCPGSTRSTDV